MFSGPLNQKLIGGELSQTAQKPMIMVLVEAEEQLMTSNVGPAGGDKVYSEEYGFWSQTFWLCAPGFPLASDCRPQVLHPLVCSLIWTMKFLAVCLR